MQHYVKQKTKFSTVACGHCLLKVSTPSRGRKFPNSDCCDKWEADNKSVEKTKTDIQSTLLQMAKEIEEIAIFIKN